MYNNELQDFEPFSTLSGHINEVKCVRWSGDDRKIASCSRDKNIWIWEFDKISFDYVCYAILEGHTHDVKFVEWFPNEENKLVSGSYDDTIRIWEGDDDDYICKDVLEGHKSIVWWVQIVNTSLFSVSEDSTVIQWEFNGETEKYSILRVYEGLHFLSIYALCTTKNKYLITVHMLKCREEQTT
jgi:WD40 repeat protein